MDRRRLTEEEVVEILVGNSVVGTTENTLTLLDGTVLEVERSNSDCCSYIELERLASSEGIITAAKFDDNETDGTGAYKAWIYVLTEAGELNIAEADGDASNGYYLHGFALSVWMIQEPVPGASDDEIAAAIASIKGTP